MTNLTNNKSIPMKKDIPIRKVESVGIAIVPKNPSELKHEMWEVYLLNLRPDSIQSVLINSKGYGTLQEQKVETTILRHFFEEIAGKSIVPIEPIQPKLFSLANEFWVSFSADNYMYDRKYVFLPGSISADHLTTIPILGKKGIMIK